MHCINAPSYQDVKESASGLTKNKMCIINTQGRSSLAHRARTPLFEKFKGLFLKILTAEHT